MSRVRIYHPETNEPFDVPEHVGTSLRLAEGWLSSPFTKVEELVATAAPVVSEWVANRGAPSSKVKDKADPEAPEEA